MWYFPGVREYVTEYENYVLLTSVLSAVAALFSHQSLQILKWVSSFGLCFAYCELIFMCGRVPRYIAIYLCKMMLGVFNCFSSKNNSE